MKQVLQAKQSQKLVLTPQLKQSLNILQLSQPDLDQLIEQELIDNPLLEREEPSTDQSGIHSTNEGLGLEPQLIAPFINAHDDWDASSHLKNTRATLSEQNSKSSSIEQNIAAHESWREHANSQIRLSRLSERDQLIASALILCLDDDAYLPIETKEVVNILQPTLRVEVDKVNAVLSYIKSVEPIGMGAYDLQERILLLLASETNDLTRQNAINIVSNHFELLSNRDFSKLDKQAQLSKRELVSAYELITSVNPRITARFHQQQKHQVIPDIIVARHHGVWTAKLREDLVRTLSINKKYVHLLKNSPDKNSEEFLNLHTNRAHSFIAAVGSRYETMLAIANSIVDQQSTFFEYGVKHLKPMTLQNVAARLDMHESTVSRATNGKYLQSPCGTFELKYFFTSAINNVDGSETTSSTAIRYMIKELINGEPNNKPLSDNKIAQELKNRGHVIARRTVAKYRESLQIAPSNQRKSLQSKTVGI